MSKHLKLFNTLADYDNFLLNVTFSTPVPNVSYVEATDDVYYNEKFKIPMLDNLIIYEAPAKLPYIVDDKDPGINRNAFGNANIIDHTFENGIGTLTFSTNVEKMSTWAFHRTAITKVILPKTLLNVGSEVFTGDYNLNTIVCYAVNAPVLVGSMPFCHLNMNMGHNGELIVPIGSTGYQNWFQNTSHNANAVLDLAYYDWTMVEQDI